VSDVVLPHLALQSVTGRSALGSLGGAHPMSFDLMAGQIGVVFGGKETSSLFRLIMGSGLIESGEIVLFGSIVRDKDDQGDMAFWRQRIGFGFREKGLISNLSIMDNVDLPARYHGYYVKGIPAQSYAEHALAESGVDPRVWDVRPSRISWEVRKRVLLARAIVLRPKILILDDPSALMASTSMPELLRWLFRQKDKGTAILCGTNDYPFGLAVADWVLNPRTNMPTTDYRSFIDEAWIDSAALLRKAAERRSTWRSA
jgi:ABC-type transporter Mla maintaining outer membrane lipid asymmetry ATPase subunit MlaF